MARNVFSRSAGTRKVGETEEGPWEPSGEQDGVTYGEKQTLGGAEQQPEQQPAVQPAATSKSSKSSG